MSTIEVVQKTSKSSLFNNLYFLKNISFSENCLRQNLCFVINYRTVYGKRENNNNDKHWYPTKRIIQKCTLHFSKITNHSWKHNKKQNPRQKPPRKRKCWIFDNCLIFMIQFFYFQDHYTIHAYISFTLPFIRCFKNAFTIISPIIIKHDKILTDSQLQQIFNRNRMLDPHFENR